MGTLRFYDKARKVYEKWDFDEKERMIAVYQRKNGKWEDVYLADDIEYLAFVNMARARIHTKEWVVFKTKKGGKSCA